MFIDAKQSRDEVEFKVYAYDASGKDVIYSIWARTEAGALAKFRAIYGPKPLVDFIRVSA